MIQIHRNETSLLLIDSTDNEFYRLLWSAPVLRSGLCSKLVLVEGRVGDLAAEPCGALRRGRGESPSTRLWSVGAPYTV